MVLKLSQSFIKYITIVINTCIRTSSGFSGKYRHKREKLSRFAIKTTNFFCGKIWFRKKLVSTCLHCFNVATSLEIKFALNEKWNSLGDLKVAQHNSKEVKVLNIHVHVMKIHAHWYMFRKGIGRATHPHFHCADGLFYKSQVTKKQGDEWNLPLHPRSWLLWCRRPCWRSWSRLWIRCRIVYFSWASLGLWEQEWLQT